MEEKIAAKYACLDTNALLMCARASQVGADLSILEKIKSKLTEKSLSLICPETITLEYKRLKDVIRVQLAEAFDKNAKAVKMGYDAHDKIIRAAIQKEKTKALENFDKASSLIEEILKHENTIKLVLNNEIFLNAVRRQLQLKKPSKSRAKLREAEILQGGVVALSIEPDCLIVEELKAYFNKHVEPYSLFFCSGNTSDFAEETEGKKEPRIHKDIESDFKKITLYSRPDLLLQKEFSAVLPKSSVSALDTLAKAIKEQNDAFNRLMGPSVTGPSSLINSLTSLSNSASAQADALADLGKSVANVPALNFMPSFNEIKPLESLLTSQASFIDSSPTANFTQQPNTTEQSPSPESGQND